MGYLCDIWGTGIIGSDSTLGGEYYFFSNWIWFGSLSGYNFYFYLVWGAGDDFLVTFCGFTLEYDWAWVLSCCTNLIWFYVGSSVVFDDIWPWNMSSSFMSASIFLWPTVQTDRQVLDILTLWLGMLLNEWMHRRKKLLTSWYFKEIILLYLQCVFPLGFKCRLYNRGSAQLQVLCTILGPHVGPIVSFYWFYNGIRPRWMVAPKVFCCSQMYPPTLHELRYWGCNLMVWSFSMWFVISLVVCPTGELATSCQSHCYPIQSNFKISWYTSIKNFFCTCL